MKARLVVFPVKGRNWCFSRSVDPNSVAAASALGSQSSSSSSSRAPSTLKELWNKLRTSSSSNSADSNVEVLVDFVSLKMDTAWTALQNAPQGSLKNKIYGVGLKLLSGVKPSEIFLKSITKEVTRVDITYPSSLNARLVRRRLRHIALRGTVIHKKYLYGSASLLPLTTAFTVLPLPNIPFFWVLFRTYSHWRALEGSKKLLQLVSDSSIQEAKPAETVSPEKNPGSDSTPWVLQPSDELEKYLHDEDACDGLSKSVINDICERFNLNTLDVVKYQNSM